MGLTVVMVTFESSNYLEHSLEFMARNVPSCELVIIDNASEDASIEIAKRICPGATILANSENVGFARAVNQALKLVRTDLVLLLNPDCFISQDVIGSLVSAIRGDSKIGAISPRITSPSGRLIARSAGYEPTARHLWHQALGLSTLPGVAHFFRGFNLSQAGEKTSKTAVDWVSGACLLTRTNQFAQIGGLNERWFMYAEDLDFCRSLRNNGLTVVHDSSVQAGHILGGSRNESESGVWTLWIENLLDYYCLRYAPSYLTKFLWKCSISCLFISRASVYAIKGRLSTGHRRLWESESKKFLIFFQAVWLKKFK